METKSDQRTTNETSIVTQLALDKILIKNKSDHEKLSIENKSGHGKLPIETNQSQVQTPFVSKSVEATIVNQNEQDKVVENIQNIRSLETIQTSKPVVTSSHENASQHVNLNQEMSSGIEYQQRELKKQIILNQPTQMVSQIGMKTENESRVSEINTTSSQSVRSADSQSVASKSEINDVNQEESSQVSESLEIITQQTDEQMIPTPLNVHISSQDEREEDQDENETTEVINDDDEEESDEIKARKAARNKALLQSALLQTCIQTLDLIPPDIALEIKDIIKKNFTGINVDMYTKKILNMGCFLIKTVIRDMFFSQMVLSSDVNKCKSDSVEYKVIKKYLVSMIGAKKILKIVDFINNKVMANVSNISKKQFKKRKLKLDEYLLDNKADKYVVDRINNMFTNIKKNKVKRIIRSARIDNSTKESDTVKVNVHKLPDHVIKIVIKQLEKVVENVEEKEIEEESEPEEMSDSNDEETESTATPQSTTSMTRPSDPIQLPLVTGSPRPMDDVTDEMKEIAEQAFLAFQDKDLLATAEYLEKLFKLKPDDIKVFPINT